MNLDDFFQVHSYMIIFGFVLSIYIVFSSNIILFHSMLIGLIDLFIYVKFLHALTLRVYLKKKIQYAQYTMKRFCCMKASFRNIKPTMYNVAYFFQTHSSVVQVKWRFSYYIDENEDTFHGTTKYRFTHVTYQCVLSKLKCKKIQSKNGITSPSLNLYRLNILVLNQKKKNYHRISLNVFHSLLFLSSNMQF